MSAAERVVTIANINTFFAQDINCVKHGENSLQSGDLISSKILNRTISARVAASMKKKQVYDVEIALHHDYSVERGSCTCPRGKFVCHHMACALLHAHYNFSKTDVACSWVPQPRERTTGQPILPQHTFDVLIDEGDFPEKVANFKQHLKNTDVNKGLLWLMADEPAEEDDFLVPFVEEILCTDAYEKEGAPFLINNLELTKEQVLDVAARTTGQQDNSAWLIARRHRLTASNFGDILGAARRGKYSPSLFKKLTGSYDLDLVKQIQWGRQKEKVALEEAKNYCNLITKPTGLWLLRCGYIGASPDGLIADDDKGIVEVKCPFKYRNSSLQEVAEKNYIIYWQNGQYVINKNHNYVLPPNTRRTILHWTRVL